MEVKLITWRPNSLIVKNPTKPTDKDRDSIAGQGNNFYEKYKSFLSN